MHHVDKSCISTKNTGCSSLVMVQNIEYPCHVAHLFIVNEKHFLSNYDSTVTVMIENCQ